MTKALNVFEPNDFFNFGNMPILKSFFNNWVSDNFTDSPKINVKETDKAYEIEIANPGMTKNDVHVNIEDGVLFVKINVESSKDEENEHKYHVRQWSKSSYEESWNLPENVIEDQISAKTSDGVLTINIPKKEVEAQRSPNIREINVE